MGFFGKKKAGRGSASPTFEVHESDGTVDTHQSIGYNPIGPTDGRCHGSGRGLPPVGAAG